jgi:3-oxoadipate enol-lactonase
VIEREPQSFTAGDGLTLRYVVDDFTDPWRKPETLVLLHAAMGSARRFYAWVPHLARHFRVVRPDLRGHGRSDIPGPSELSLERLGQDVVEIMDHLGCRAAHVAGSSAGGVIALQAALTAPERVRSLGLFATLPGLKVSAHKTDYGAWIAGIRADGVRAFLARTIADRFKLDAVEPGFVEWFLDEAARNDVELLARFVPLMAGADLSGRLGEIRCPTLAVVPGSDPIHRMDEYELLRRGLRDCRFVVYDGLPHNITDAVPDRCAAELRDFLLHIRDKAKEERT